MNCLHCGIPIFPDRDSLEPKHASPPWFTHIHGQFFGCLKAWKVYYPNKEAPDSLNPTTYACPDFRPSIEQALKELDILNDIMKDSQT